MQNHAVPRKTEAARAMLSQSRQGLPAALRMLLITIDGRKSLDELRRVARSLGLADSAFAQLHDAGLLSWQGISTSAPAQVPDPARTREEQAKRLVKAKFFALDLATRMLAGKEGELRERAREVSSESSFEAWMNDCASRIALAADAERAALFRERVAAVSG